MNIDDIKLLTKLRERYRMNRVQTVLEILFVIALFATACFFGAGYMVEKGRQLASQPKIITDNQSLNNNKKQKIVTLSSNAVHLSGPGRYIINIKDNKKTGYLRRIYGLSTGDKVELRSASSDLDIIVEPSDHLKMGTPFHLNNENDKIFFTCDGNDVCTLDNKINNGN